MQGGGGSSDKRGSLSPFCRTPTPPPGRRNVTGKGAGAAQLRPARGLRRLLQAEAGVPAEQLRQTDKQRYVGTSSAKRKPSAPAPPALGLTAAEHKERQQTVVEGRRSGWRVWTQSWLLFLSILFLKKRALGSIAASLAASGVLSVNGRGPLPWNLGGLLNHVTYGTHGRDALRVFGPRPWEASSCHFPSLGALIVHVRSLTYTAAVMLRYRPSSS